MFSIHAAVFIHLKSLFAAHYKLCKLNFVWSECLCVCAWVHACVCMLKIVSMDKILYFTNTLLLLLLLNKRVKYHYVNEQHNINERKRWWGGGGGGGGGIEKKGVLKAHLSVRTNHHLGGVTLAPRIFLIRIDFFFMDGSKTGRGRAAVSTEHFCKPFTCWLPDNSSVFIAELWAILLAHKHVYYCLTHFHHYTLYLSKSMTTLSTDSRTIYGFDQR